MRLAIGAVVVSMILAGCGGGSGEPDPTDGASSERAYSFGQPPEAPTGPLDPGVADRVSELLDGAYRQSHDCDSRRRR